MENDSTSSGFMNFRPSTCGSFHSSISHSGCSRPGQTSVIPVRRVSPVRWSRSAYSGTSYFAEPTQRSQQVAALTQRRIEDDVRDLEKWNAEINQTNERALPLLRSLTNQNFGLDPEQWKKWWTEQLGYVYDSRYSEDKPVFTEVIAPHTACFAAGTLVQTVTGPRKIESIAVGDRVLSQQSSTGAMSFQPVLATHLNGPSETLRISLAGETIVATGIHRFWKAGTGWTMARDLKAGDRLRMLGGVATIDSIEPGATQMVFNLNVAENRDFLVGTAGLLVHDFGFVLTGFRTVRPPERTPRPSGAR